MANPSEKKGNNKVVCYKRQSDLDEFEERHDLKLLSMPMMFHGFNREKEMSAMVYALTRVICGDEEEHGGYDHQKMEHSAFGHLEVGVLILIFL